MDLSALPKVELHLHLDCSLTYEFVTTYRPDVTPEQFRDQYVAPPKCRDLADYLTRSEKSIQLMQTTEQLQRSVRELFTLIDKDSIIYAEIRFAPLEHTRNGLSAEEVVEIVCDEAFRQRDERGIEFGIILCTLRHYSKEQSMQTAKLVRDFSDEGVCGFDIAADEAGYPLKPHIPAFRYAGEQGLNRTAHAGEALGAESVRDVLDQLGVTRIGHGVRSVEDATLIDRLVDEDIHLEICPTSNIQTNVFEAIEDHTINRLVQVGVSVSINTDSRTITPTTLNKEYELLKETFDWGVHDLKQCNIEAAVHSFAPDEVKKQLISRIERDWPES